MASIHTTKKDVIWNYLATIVSMGSGLILLPILLLFLSAEELGLWYAFLAVSNLTLLFEFGFNPTFARNIVYCLSGASSLAKEGRGEHGDTINWHLLASVLRASKLVYLLISVIALVLSATFGSAYVMRITGSISGANHWIAWLIICCSIFINLYYLWVLTYLRGFGDIAGESKAKAISKIGQLVITLVLCVLGFGLIGAALGFLLCGVLMRFVAKRELRRHEKLFENIEEFAGEVSIRDVQQVVKQVSHLSIRDGVVQLALFVTTQAATIIASLYLGLAEAGTYSLQLQLANALGSMSSVFISSHYPAYQSAYTNGNTGCMRKIVEQGFSAFWFVGVFGTLIISLVGIPILSLIKTDTIFDVPLFVVMAIYSCLLQQYSSFCSLIVATNRIPYVKSYIASAVCGVLLSVMLMRLFNLGAWGLVLGQAFPQLIYNDWRWPVMVTRELKTTVLRSILSGFEWWIAEIKGRIVLRR